MTNNNFFKSSLVIGIILLFFGVAVAPCINFNVVKASNNNDLIDVTTEACGIKGFGNNTVKLTKQQYQDLQHYLVDFRSRLNQTSTRGESVPVFNEAVVELDRYGLLPNGMSIEQAQKLINGDYQNQRFTKLLEKIYSKHPESIDDDENLICLIAGEADIISFYPFSIGFLSLHCPNLYSLFNLLTLYTILIIPTLLLLILYALSPVKLFSIVTFGNYMDLGGWVYGWSPSKGWMYSSGINGVKNWEGKLFGQFGWINNYIYSNAIGVIGFTGIDIWTPDNQYFFGSAVHVKLGPNPP